jgi:uncharacterized protein with HEPN domain
VDLEVVWDTLENHLTELEIATNKNLSEIN